MRCIPTVLLGCDSYSPAGGGEGGQGISYPDPLLGDGRYPDQVTKPLLSLFFHNVADNYWWLTWNSRWNFSLQKFMALWSSWYWRYLQFFISLEYYFDLQCITISCHCYNLLATSMFITHNTFCKAKFHLIFLFLKSSCAARHTRFLPAA